MTGQQAFDQEFRLNQSVAGAMLEAPPTASQEFVDVQRLS